MESASAEARSLIEEGFSSGHSDIDRMLAEGSVAGLVMSTLMANGDEGDAAMRALEAVNLFL